MVAAAVLDEFKKSQREDAKELQRIIRTGGPEREKAAEEARRRLRAANIIDGNGRLNPWYR